MLEVVVVVLVDILQIWHQPVSGQDHQYAVTVTVGGGGGNKYLAQCVTGGNAGTPSSFGTPITAGGGGGAGSWA